MNYFIPITIYHVTTKSRSLLGHYVTNDFLNSFHLFQHIALTKKDNELINQKAHWRRKYFAFILQYLRL